MQESPRFVSVCQRRTPARLTVFVRMMIALVNFQGDPVEFAYPTRANLTHIGLGHLLDPEISFNASRAST